MMGLSINHDTRRLAIAIGELRDDAVVDDENIFRAAREPRARQPSSGVRVWFAASNEVRSHPSSHADHRAVFVPLFALSASRPLLRRWPWPTSSPSCEPVVSVTLTPVMA
jgi:HME family heavy-metal exporter